MFLFKVLCFFGAKSVIKSRPYPFCCSFCVQNEPCKQKYGTAIERQSRKYCCALKNRLSCDKGLKQLLTGAARATSRLRSLLD